MADNIQTNIQIQADTKQALDKIKELNQAISTFNRAINQQNAEAMKTAKALERQVLGTNFANNFNTQIVRMSSSVEQFSQKLDKGKVGFTEYRKLLERENGMLEQVAQRRVKLMQSMQIALTGQIRGGQRGALITPKEFDQLATSAANVQAFGKQMDIAAQKTILLNEALRQGAIQLTNWGKNMQWAGRQLTVGLTLPITAFAAASASAFKDVEEQLIQIRRVYGDLETTDYEKALGEKQLLDAAEAWTKYGVSVSDSLKVGAQVAATGATGAEAVSQMNEAIRFATLGNFELADSQAAVIAMMSSLGIASKDLRGEIDYLNAVENQTLLTMQDVADAVPRVGPVLKDMGGNVRDLTALLAAMKEGGVDAAEGANALKSGLASLINPTAEAKEAFSEFGINLNSIVQQGAGDPVAMIQNLGKSIEGLSNLGQQRLIESLFGKYQFARWSALFDNINKAGSQAQETLKLASMSAEDLARISNSELAKIEESPLTKFNKNLEELKMALVPIGEMVLKALNPLLDIVGKIIDFVGQNDIAKWIAGIGGAAVAIVGPITMIAGLFANFMGNILQFRSFLRKRAIGETFMTELEIQGKLAAAALDEFGREAQSGLSTLNQQSVAVRDLASEYNILAASVERARIEISHTANDPTRSRVGTDVAGQQAAQYRYRRRFATGGTVPGTGSGDKIPAMLEPGEFVVSKSAAKKFRPTLDSMNAGTLRGMEEGGLIVIKPEEIIQTKSGRVTSTGTRLSQAHVVGTSTVPANEVDVNKLSKQLRTMFETLVKVFGEAEVSIRTFSKAMFTMEHEANLALREDKAGLHPEQYSEQIQRYAPVREAELRKLVGPAAAAKIPKGAMLQLENVMSDTFIAAGKKIHDSDVERELVRIATSAETAETELGQLAKAILTFGTSIDKAEVVVSERALEAEARARGLTQPGQRSQLDPERNIFLGRVRGGSARIGKASESRGFRVGAQRERVLAGQMNVITPIMQQSKIGVKELSNSITGELEEQLQTSSPSKITKKIGQDIDKGLAQGMLEGIPQVEAAAEQVAQASMKPLHGARTALVPTTASVGGRYGGHIQTVTIPGGQQLPKEAPISLPAAQRLPNLASEAKDLAQATKLSTEAQDAAAVAQAKVAAEANSAASGLDKLSDTSTKSNKQIEDQMSGGGGISKFLYGLDAISGALMFSDGALGEFANKLFIASSALTAIDMFTGGGVGKVAGKVKGGIGGAIGKIAPKLAGLAPALGAVSAPLLGVAAAAAAVGGALYLLHKRANKYDDALANSADNIKAAAEKFGFELKTTQITGVGGIQKDSETVTQVKEFMDETLKNQAEYIKSLNNQQARQDTIKAIVAQYIAAGMPKQYAQELATQLAGATKTNATELVKQIGNLYDEQGALRVDAGQELMKQTMSGFNYIAEKITQSIEKPQEVRIAGQPQNFATSQGGGGVPFSRWQAHDEFGRPVDDRGRVVGAAPATQLQQRDIGLSAQEIETVSKSLPGVLQALGAQFQQGLISAKDFFDQLGTISTVTDKYGKSLDGTVKELIKVNPALAFMQDKLKESGAAGDLLALQMMNVDVTPLTEGLAKAGADAEEFGKKLRDEVMPMIGTILSAEQPLIDALRQKNVGEQSAIDLLQTGKGGTKKQIANSQEGLDKRIQAAKDALEAVDEEYQKKYLDKLEEQQYNIDRSNYKLNVQKDIQQDLLEVQQKKVDLIDEEIDKIEEARDKQTKSIEDSADAQVKAIEHVRDAVERDREQKSEFYSLGEALQSGNIAEALRIQSQSATAFTYDDQIAQVNDWREAALEAIDNEADAKIRAEEDKKTAVEATMASIQAQIDVLDKQLEANDKLSASISEQTAVRNHQKEADKAKFEAEIKYLQDVQTRNADLIKQHQANIAANNTEIGQIQKSGQELIKAIETFALKFGLDPKKDIAALLRGDQLKNYLESGGTSSINLTMNGKEFKFQTETKKHSGGPITSKDKTGSMAGLAADEVPTILQTGEFVVQRDAVNAIGQDALSALNEKKKYVPAQHKAQLNSEMYERYHSGGLVGLANATGAIATSLLSERAYDATLQNYAIAGAAAAAQKQALAELGNFVSPEVDWSKVSGGENGWYWPAPGYAQNADDFGYIGNRTYSDGRPRRHAGWDIGMPNGSIVHAIKSGTIVNSATSSSAAGKWMAIDHGGGLYTRYLHLHEALKKVGDYVKGGSPIARADSSGTNTPHLHFEITRNRFTSEHADAFNPLNFFRLHDKYNFHDGGIVGTNEVPAILEKGEFVIPKDKWQYGSGNSAMSMPTYSAPTGGGFTMPQYSASTASTPMTVSAGGGGGGGGGISSSYSNNASNSYVINVNVSNANAGAAEIANMVHARINRTQRISRR